MNCTAMGCHYLQVPRHVCLKLYMGHQPRCLCEVQPPNQHPPMQCASVATAQGALAAASTPWAAANWQEHISVTTGNRQLAPHQHSNSRYLSAAPTSWQLDSSVAVANQWPTLWQCSISKRQQPLCAHKADVPAAAASMQQDAVAVSSLAMPHLRSRQNSTSAIVPDSTNVNSRQQLNMAAGGSSQSLHIVAQQQCEPEQQSSSTAATKWQQQAQQLQQQQQHNVLDPSMLPIADRVSLLRSRIAGRRGTSSCGDSSSLGTVSGSSCTSTTNSMTPAGSVLLTNHIAINLREQGLQQVLSCCKAAGVSDAAASVVLEHVARAKVCGKWWSLAAFLASYQQLVEQYGEQLALNWLKKAPPIIRNASEVPERLLQLQQLLGGAPMRQVLALTRRCPQVLAVEADLLAPRLQGICNMLHLSVTQHGPEVLAAAPALLAMSLDTLAVKAQHLQAFARIHPRWAAKLASSSPTSLAIMLTYSMERQLRLVYVAQQSKAGQATPPCMSTLLALSKKKLLELHPGFPEWCKQNTPHSWFVKGSATPTAAAAVMQSSAAAGPAASEAAAAGVQGTAAAGTAALATVAP